eukprot:3133648-Pyramimonas_sp.AAC.1
MCAAGLPGCAAAHGGHLGHGCADAALRPAVLQPRPSDQVRSDPINGHPPCPLENERRDRCANAL